MVTEANKTGRWLKEEEGLAGIWTEKKKVGKKKWKKDESSFKEMDNKEKNAGR